MRQRDETAEDLELKKKKKGTGLLASTNIERSVDFFFLRPKKKKMKQFVLYMQREAKRTKITLRLWSQEAGGIVKL